MKTKISSLLPMVFLLSVWFVFASPYFLQGKIPYSSTYQVNHFAPWSTYEKFWGPVKNGAMPDVTSQIYPWKKFTIDTWKKGEVPLWNPYSFSGTPHLANYQSAVFTPLNILFLILPFVDAWSLLVLLQPLLAGIFTYFFARSLSLSKIGSVFSAISFMFCGFVTVWMSYATLGYAILFLPFSLWCIENFIKKRQIRFLVLLTFSIPLSFFSGHFQMSLYFLIVVVVYSIFRAIIQKNFSLFLLLMGYVLFGLLISAPQILPSIELYTLSFRSTLFQNPEVIPFGYFPTFLAPDFFGNPVTRNDWFGHYAEWNSYVGVLPFLFAVYAVLRKKSYQIYFLLIISFFSIFVAYDTFLSQLVVGFHIPVLSTSATSRIIVIASFCLALLGGYGIDQLQIDIKKRNKFVLYFLACFLGLFFILWIAVFLKLFIPIDKLSIARSNLILPTTIFLVSGGLIVSSFVFSKTNLLTVVIPGIIILTSFDMLRFAIKWQPFDPRSFVFPQISVTNFFQKISGPQRVFGNLGGEAHVYFRLPSVEGYDAVYIKRYGEFISSIEKGTLSTPQRSVVGFPKHSSYTPLMLNFLGIKYVVHKIGDSFTNWTLPIWLYKDTMNEKIFADEKYEIYKNSSAFPRAFLVGNYQVLQKDEEIISELYSKDFDLQTQVVLEKDPGFKIDGFINSPVAISSYANNSVALAVSSGSNAILVLTDTFYPGWRAYIDGLEVPILRANYTFRAVPITKGEHIVSFVYDPSSFRSGVFFFLFSLGAISGLTFFLKKRRFSW